MEAARWRNLDDADDQRRLLAFLDELAAVPAVQHAKRRSFDLLSLRSGDRVLDACCGTGVDLMPLAELVAPGGQVTGLDRSSAVLAEARARIAPGSRVALHEGDVVALPFADGAFDAARIDRGLLHVPQPERAIAELARVTRRGGVVVVTEARWRTRSSPSAAQRPPGRREDAEVLPFLPYLFARAGLEQVRIDQDDQPVRLERSLAETLGADREDVFIRFVHARGLVARG